MTSRQYLKLHPEKYVMVTYEFGEPIYMGELDGRMRRTATTDKNKAVKWTALDNAHAGKLEYAALETGYKNLVWEQI